MSPSAIRPLLHRISARQFEAHPENYPAHPLLCLSALITLTALVFRARYRPVDEVNERLDDALCQDALTREIENLFAPGLHTVPRGSLTLDYPISILAYVALGMLGAISFLFLLLLFDKDVQILQNSRLPLWQMALLYVLIGGGVAAVVNVASNPDFGPSQFAVAFASGLGWPALATGIGAGKAVGEASDRANSIAAISTEASAKLKQNEETLKALADALNSVRSILPD